MEDQRAAWHDSLSSVPESTEQVSVDGETEVLGPEVKGELCVFYSKETRALCSWKA